ncbi:MAG TPA: hypothetical protein VLA77_03760 [Candidatus Saccharimonadales bacterium]|nr:hypothetical protein [Candidatus Saccharimonadales bacterium]
MEPENKPDSNTQPTTPPPATPPTDPTPVEPPVTPVGPMPMSTGSSNTPLNPDTATVGTGKKSSVMVWLLIILVLAIAGFLVYWFLLR